MNDKTNDTVDVDDDETFDDELLFGSDIPPGTYDGSLVSVTPKIVDVEGESRELLRWTFAIDVDGETEEIDALSSRATGTRSKPRAWITVLLGRTPAGGERVRLTDLVGKECLVSVERKADGYVTIGGLVGKPKAKAKIA